MAATDQECFVYVVLPGQRRFVTGMRRCEQPVAPLLPAGGSERTGLGALGGSVCLRGAAEVKSHQLLDSTLDSRLDSRLDSTLNSRFD